MEPEELTFQLLREMTDGFSEKQKVGEGGFGTVYKGVTKTGVDVAVKIPRHGNNPDLDFKQFQNEFDNLTKVKHINIVQFLGYCYEIEPTSMECDGRIVRAEETHRALCFEYLHNGSLQNHLSDESCGLDWHTRYKIIKGTCEGLRYIHEEESLLHLDLKPDNILLDKDMVPKIADFGLSKIFDDELTRASQISFGTLGYKPPEYIDKKEISKKFDIFSLGVIIMRIVSGPNGYPKCLDMPSREFIKQVQENWRKRWQATCRSDYSLEPCCHQVGICTQIALDCLEKDKHKRLDIVEIINKLNETEACISKKPPEDGHKMKLKKEHKVITDQHQYLIGSSSNDTESDTAQENLLDVGEELIVGRDGEKKEIMASLLEIIKSEKIVILPIYGIGGIGKTTFAKLIYSATNFKYYSHVWVYVSQRFDLEKIGKSIDSQLSGKENQANEHQISKDIMIVLDDLWEDNPLKIEELKNMLNFGDSIKKVIVLVTTRSADIAQKICRNTEPHQIKSLTDEMCWDIIKQKVDFEAIHDKDKLVDIGKEISQKCGGVALAAQTLGSMLRSMKHDEWMTVKNSDIWNETISEDTSLPQHVLASLKLSYAFSMDDCLKKCFTYCAIFPKGHKIFKYDLIYQWISLDLIMPTKILSSLQLCEKYIVCLLGLTFLQHSMSIMTCRAYGEHDTVFMMHDLVHDLAISLLGDDILDQSKQGNTAGSSCSYALLADCSKPLESCTTSPARLSALHFLDCPTTELHGPAFELAESLRVLDLSECFILKLPDSIGRLKQLRYLNAPRIRGRMVPECITELLNLRYLSLHGSCSILALPELIGEMKGLVHLDLSGCMAIEKLPESFGDLKSLEHVDFTGCKNITGVSQCLAGLTKLHYLNLSNCENIGDLPRALGSLTELQYLNLFDCSYLSGNKLAEAAFLGSLTKLKYLNLSSSNKLDIIRLPEALGSLTGLKYLNLSHHSRMEKLPASFGNLCNLVHLDLSHCYYLRDVTADLNRLTKLQYLDLYVCGCSDYDNLEGLQEVFGKLSELRHLNLGYCTEVSHPDKSNGLLGQIFTLTNLEYLNLCENDFDSIPETLSNLRKLHTLDLSSCRHLQRLPASISRVDSLKFLYTTGCEKLDTSTMPQYTSSTRMPQDFVNHAGDGESSCYTFQLEYETSDRLMISRLENVKSAKEASTIKLREMTDITLLALQWTRDAKRFVDDVEVLRGLEPPYCVSEFFLEGYNSTSFPSWVMDIDAYLPGLTSIEMSDLTSCNNLPPLGQLPNLKRLEIRQMNGIKKIDTDLYGGSRAFPRLEQILIDGMECLEEWNTASSSDDDGSSEAVFPRLRLVEIRQCPRLRFKPCPPQSIYDLRVYSSDEVLLSPWGHAGACSAKELRVECCVVPLHRWSLLRHLPCLKILRIINCSDITWSPPYFLRGLTSLSVLFVTDCNGIVSLPDWLEDFTSLYQLSISNCNIKTLPDTIQKLTYLQHLLIFGCPELGGWYESEENKMKVAHIMSKFIS